MRCSEARPVVGTTNGSSTRRFDGALIVGQSDDDGVAGDGDLESIPDGLESTVNALFAVGLDLAATRMLVDDGAGRRIDGAINELDAIISAVRSLGFPVRTERAVTDGAQTANWEGGRTDGEHGDGDPTD